MLIFATSYEGLLLLLQIPASLLCALVALVLAFTRFRRPSVGFAICGILITVTAVALELNGYGLHTLTRSREGAFGFLCIVFSPMILCCGVLLLGRSRGRPLSK
jgi:hypothetical protein